MKTLLLSMGLLGLSSVAFAAPSLIGGKVVDQKKFPEVVWIGNCTATVVGPRVVLTAGHCVGRTANIRFKTNGKTYAAKVTRSPYYVDRTASHDLALGVTEDIIDIDPASIGGIPKRGDSITIFGYGCKTVGGRDQLDGKLRMGKAKVTGFSMTDIVSRGGAALCFGDSGGPAFKLTEDKQMLLMGVNSKGDIRITNYNARTDLEKSRKFINDFAKKHNVSICGINKTCSPRKLP